MAEIGVQRTQYLLNTPRHRVNPEGAHVASMPQTRCTFIGYKFRLDPGTQNHPDNLRNPVLRNPMLTRIEAQPGQCDKSDFRTPDTFTYTIHIIFGFTSGQEMRNFCFYYKWHLVSK